MPETIRKSFRTGKGIPEVATEKGKEISKQIFSSDELQGITSFDDALKLAAEKYGTENLALASAVIGDGFKLLENKDQLIGKQMIILSWDFNMGDFGEFVSMRVVTAEGGKFVVNDGSTGIRDQIAEYHKKTGRKGGMLVEKGFRRSDYEFEDETGKKRPATTYYLDLSA